jgi:probable HAF family extracellular repeat protein
MRKVTSANLGVLAVLSAIAFPILLCAQERASSPKPRYRLVDLGTLGGPNSFFFELNNNLNAHRALATNCSDTANLDPASDVNPLFANSPYIQHAFRATPEGMTDLGALPNGTSSCGQGINSHGDVAGYSSTGGIDPLTGIPEVEAVLWRDGKIIGLGNLGGNNSYAAAINDRGQVAGNAYNAIPDPYSSIITPFGATQVHAFLWHDGDMRDLGTLGGPDSIAFYMDEGGEVAGISFVNSNPNATTGIPTLHSFLWRHGKMQDLGTLGGTIVTPNAMNNRGEVAGFSNIAGDQTGHAFLWDRDALKDLGTLGGSFSTAFGLNDDEVVVGRADLPDGHIDAFLWEKGKIRDLGNLGCASNAWAINSRRQVVGATYLADCETIHAMFWQDGRMYDLNDLVQPGSGLELLVAPYINETGVIAGYAYTPTCSDPNGCIHAVLLLPRND